MIGSVIASQANDSDKNRENRRVFHILDSTRIPPQNLDHIKKYEH